MQRLVQGQIASKWQSWDLNLDLYGSKRVSAILNCPSPSQSTQLLTCLLSPSLEPRTYPNSLARLNQILRIPVCMAERRWWL